MNALTSNWLDNNKEKLIGTLQNVIRFHSVRDDKTAGRNAPFGEEIGKCLEYVLSTAANLGFSVKSYDGYIGIVECGEGDEQLGILAHLDVVPEGSGWKYPAYGGEIHEGLLYGRGALDDKGPGIAALFALAAVKECGFKFKRRVRVIFGCDEECDMGCMKHYAKVEKLPDLSFSPDAEYPLMNSEKMIYGAEYGRKFSSRIRMNGGTVSNAVAGECKVFVPISSDDVESVIKDIENTEGLKFNVFEDEKCCRIEIIGLAAHASTPELGHNAFYGALDLVRRLHLDEDSRTAEKLYQLMKYYHHGEGFALDCEDASGRLTLNCGVIDWDENGINRLTVDIRAPISANADEISVKLRKGFITAGCVELKHHYSDGYYIPPESEIVSKLITVYNDFFNADAKPMAIGGGTYARYLKNAVAFGPERPGEPACIHMANECVSIDHLLEDAKIYADAIISLACE